MADDDQQPPAQRYWFPYWTAPPQPPPPAPAPRPAVRPQLSRRDTRPAPQPSPPVTPSPSRRQSHTHPATTPASRGAATRAVEKQKDKEEEKEKEKDKEKKEHKDKEKEHKDKEKDKEKHKEEKEKEKEKEKEHKKKEKDKEKEHKEKKGKEEIKSKDVVGEHGSKLHKELKAGVADMVHKLSASAPSSGDGHERPTSSAAGTTVITLAGENKGASMKIDGAALANGKADSASGKDRRGHKLDGSVVVASEKEQAGSKGLTAFVNSNVQVINNSLLLQSSCNGGDPGVHLKLSTKSKKKRDGGEEAGSKK
ncbi:hypothetical protein BAE44_0013700 [Dichanthelium oligosanthes]|uniref:Uncharacterized protein n=1 Tax=Dichanthelium oligosanthes TaxID=888268 RepID=A0A1E5VJN6_9POAL|nr:hypothetical protein BAE44_0013700 [Dichanthelium oligosanthes]